MQQEALESASQKLIAENTTFERNKNKKNPSWLSNFFFFGCCKPQSPLNGGTPISACKSTTTVTTHYSVGGPNSFLVSKNSAITPMSINTPEFAFPLDVAFLLGKGTEKIISKICRVNLSPLPTGMLKDLTGSKMPQEATSKINSKIVRADGTGHQSEQLRNQGDISDSRLSPFQIFSMYSERIQFEKGDWNEFIFDNIASYVAENLKNQLVIDTLSGNGEYIIQVANMRYLSYVLKLSF